MIGLSFNIVATNHTRFNKIEGYIEFSEANVFDSQKNLSGQIIKLTLLLMPA